jgi:proton-dependent oligopeptide transporter, POT family
LSSTPAPTAAEGNSTQAQPLGLRVLFAAEAWERFSYYGMRALLVLYLVNSVGYTKDNAYTIYGMYTGLVYLTPFFGGLLADRLLGARKAVVIGGVIMAIGHLAMAFDSLLFPALGFLIIGNGFFKPNISTIVGGLYAQGDPRRDGGFTIFYMGINLGAFFSPLVCGALGEGLGWHYGFAAAGVGMTIGLGVFLWGQKLLGQGGMPPGRPIAEDGQPRLHKGDWRDIGIWIVGSLALVLVILESWRFIGPVWDRVPSALKLTLGVMLVAATFGGLLKKANDDGREALQRVAVILILGVFTVFFWMGFEQAGSTMTIFADAQTNRSVGASEIPASFFQSINPLMIMLLAAPFSAMWLRMERSKNHISTPAKMAWGLIILGLGFLLMYVAQQLAGDPNYVTNVIGDAGKGEGLMALSSVTFEASLIPQSQVGPLWLVAVYIIHTVAELFLSPIGLSMVTKLAPAKMISLMMGVWFMSSAVANYLAGALEGIVEHYDLSVYFFLIGSSIGAGLLLFALTPLLKRWMHGIN